MLPPLSITAKLKRNFIIKFIKQNKIYLLASVGLVIINSCLFLFSKPAVAPELLYYPWLIEKGYVMYRDFFHVHGPFLYYLLAPFTVDKSLNTLTYFYIFIQNLNLVLVLLISKKFKSIFGFIIGGLSFVILNFIALSVNNYLWDEQIITTILLLIYYLLTTKESHLKYAFIGILIGFVSLTKINGLIIILPILFFTKRKLFLAYVLLTWSIVLLYFLINNALPQFIDNTVLFSTHYADYYDRFYISSIIDIIKNNIILINIIIILFNFIILLLIFAIHAMDKKNINTMLIVFLLFSIYSIYQSTSLERLDPFFAFLSIFIAYIYKITNKKLLLAVVFVLYLGMFFVVIKHQVIRLRQMSLLTENKNNQKMINYLRNNGFDKKSFYIMGNASEVYFFLDSPYKIYQPMMYPVISDYYKDYQRRDITEINKNNTELIVIPLPIDNEYLKTTTLFTFVKTNFTLSYKDPDFIVYTKKK